MLKNAPTLAIGGLHTAENEPLHVLNPLHVDLAEEHAPGHVDAEEQALGRARAFHGPEVVEAHRHEALCFF